MKVRTRLLGLLVVVALMAGLMPLMAVAHTPKVEAKCGELRVSLTNYRTHREKKNSVEVTINGRVVVNAYFGEKYSVRLPQPKDDDFTYEVVVKAWDDPEGEWGWSKTFRGEVTNCKEKVTTTTTLPTTTTTQPTTTTTVPVPDMCPAGLPVVKATNLDHNGWLIGDGATFVSGGIEIAVPGEWVEVSISRAFNKSLQELGDILDIDATPIQFVGLHLHTSKGTIVYEEEASYNGNLWSWGEFGVGAGMGYTSFASLEAYVAANPDLVVTQVDVLYTHPEESSTVVASVIFGCEEFIFDFEMREPTTTTTMPETTTSVAESTTSTEATTTSSQGTTPSTLPFTGIEDFYLPTAVVLVALGGLLLALSRKPEEDGIN